MLLFNCVFIYTNNERQEKYKIFNITEKKIFLLHLSINPLPLFAKAPIFLF